MTSPAELERLMCRAVEDKTKEAAFLRALLYATVYAHAPLSDDSARLRLMQFTTPEGMLALPFFTTETKAEFATQSVARVVALTGRQLMEITRGATLLLNPNDTPHCALFPEEIDALLATGEVATVEAVKLDERKVCVGKPESSPVWLIEALTALLPRLPFVDSAYLVEFRSPEDMTRATLVIALEVAHINAERAARATITAIQPRCQALKLEIDVTAFDPAIGRPKWLAEAAVEPFYARSWGGRLTDDNASDLLQ